MLPPQPLPPTESLARARRGLRLPLALLALAGPAGGAAPEEPPAGPLFSEEAEAVGLDFVHFNGMSGELYYVENMGAGGALFDYDLDGDLDLFLVQGDLLGPGKTLADALFPPRHPQPLSDRLYRNDLRPGAGPILVDVTEASGVARATAATYGMGVAVGDVDGDGDPDLYLTNFGPNRLLRNEGDGTFTDVTGPSGTDDARWSVASSFVDYDADGDLDLFVANYLDFTFTSHRQCTDPTGARDYCGPLSYEPVPNRLFRNRGDGTFEDVSAASGIEAAFGGALGVVAGDLTGDARPDLYVANDLRPNLLWINQGDGTFREDALLAGAAVNREGKPEASMGVEAADLDADGDEDLFVTHLTGETNTLYLSEGNGIFRDRTLQAGLANPSWAFTSFGTAFLDYDNDGWLDLLVVSGAVKRIEELVRRGDPYPLHQTNQLFRNLGPGEGGGVRFEEVTGRAGPALERSEVSRGAAIGDLDLDGDPDVLVTNNSGPARLLIDRVGQDRPWLALRLLAADGGTDAVGAVAVLRRPGAPPLRRRVRTDGSYASAHDGGILFGLGEAGSGTLRLTWPDGTVEEWLGLEAGRRYVRSRPAPGEGAAR